MKPKKTDDPSTAPESGKGRDKTSGNAPAAPQQRPASQGGKVPESDKDDPSAAGEEP